MEQDKKQYDLILIFISFRAVPGYLAIVKALAADYRIGIYVSKGDEAKEIKFENTNDLFLALCFKNGASEISDLENISAKCIMLSQELFTENEIEKLGHLKGKALFYILMRLTNKNMCLENLIRLGIRKFLVPSLEVYNYLLENDALCDEKSRFFIEKSEIEEVGIPFEKYRIFSDLKIDYIIASPTPFSLPGTEDKLKYLKNVVSLTDCVLKDDVIALKPHNAMEKYDYIINRRYRIIFDSFFMIPFHHIMENCFEKIKRKVNNKLIKNFLTEILIIIYNRKLLKRVVYLKDLTPFYNFNLEIFLPNVRKGLITGLSNCIWHGLFHKLPVYLAAEMNSQEMKEKRTHSQFMRYLNIPFCRHELVFDEKNFNKISEKVRNADLIRFLRKEMESCNE